MESGNLLPFSTPSTPFPGGHGKKGEEWGGKGTLGERGHKKEEEYIGIEIEESLSLCHLGSFLVNRSWRERLEGRGGGERVAERKKNGPSWKKQMHFILSSLLVGKKEERWQMVWK
jgi:hypothetical protein